MTRMPKIGDQIDVQYGIELCKHFGLYELAAKVAMSPDNYESFKFDGLSCLPDELTASVVGLDADKLTLECALPHDLKYAYGDPGDVFNKRNADIDLHRDLIKIGMSNFGAWVFFVAVEQFGSEKFGLSFSWGFANKKRNK